MKQSILCTCFVFAFAISANAAGPDAASVSALTDTQNMLQTPAQRNKVISNNPTAQTVDSQVKALTGNDQTANELYTISGKVLEDLVKETGGDPVKMMEIMNKAQTNPESLMDHLSPENKAAIHSVSQTIDNSPTTRAPASAK
jgi:hypothetical protein